MYCLCGFLRFESACCCSSQTAVARPHAVLCTKIDSILSALKTIKADTVKAGLLNSLSETLRHKKNYDTAMIVANEALLLSKKLKYEKKQNFFYIQGISFFV